MNALSDRYFSRDTIERFLDRSWMQERTPLHSLNGHRVALGILDDWLHAHRVSTLATASASDVRALLDSTQWDQVSRGCAALLGLITRFYRSLQECHVRSDDPVDSLIDQELAEAARQRNANRPCAGRRGRKLAFNHPRVV